MKKVLALVLVLILALGVFAGCAGSKEGSRRNPALRLPRHACEEPETGSPRRGSPRSTVPTEPPFPVAGADQACTGECPLL